MGKVGFIKSFKKYIAEFLMLFIAIFLGFYAENIREMNTEKTKEREYIQSIIADVNIDKKNIELTVSLNEKRSTNLDSLANQIYEYSPSSEKIRSLHLLYLNVIQHPNFFHTTDLTMQQLKNAGGMRFIQNKKAIDAILQYDLMEKKLKNQQKYYEDYQNKAIDLGMKIFNAKWLLKFKERIKEGKPIDQNFIDTATYKMDNDNHLLLSEFANAVLMFSGIVDYYIQLLKEMDTQTNTLIVTLEEQYQLKKITT